MQEDSGAAMLTHEDAGPWGAGPPGPTGRASTDRDGAGADAATPDWQKQLTSLVAGQKNIMQTIKKNQSDMRSYIGNEVKKVRDDLMLEMSQLTRRLEILESRQTDVEGKEPFHPDVSVVMANLPKLAREETTAQLREAVEKLVQEAMELPGIEVVDVTRRVGHGSSPGLVIVELCTLDDKKTVLRAKTKLKSNQSFKNVFIRSAEGHTDRLIRLNFNTLLRHFGLTQQFRITGSGRLIPRQTHASSTSVDAPAASPGRSAGNDDPDAD